jgi:hypothetical protein
MILKLFIRVYSGPLAVNSKKKAILSSVCVLFHLVSEGLYGPVFGSMEGDTSFSYGAIFSAIICPSNK